MQEFIKKVHEMRKLQKLFYKNHERNTLLAAKAAEYDVDVTLESFGFPVDDKKKKKTQFDAKSTQQPTLFG